MFDCKTHTHTDTQICSVHTLFYKFFSSTQLRVCMRMRRAQLLKAKSFNKTLARLIEKLCDLNEHMPENVVLMMQNRSCDIC